MREETVQPEIPNPDSTGPVQCTLQYRCAAMKAVYTVHAHTYTHAQQGFTTDIYNKDEKFVFGPNQPVRRRLTADRRFCHRVQGLLCCFQWHNVTAEKCFLCTSAATANNLLHIINFFCCCCFFTLFCSVKKMKSRRHQRQSAPPSPRCLVITGTNYRGTRFCTLSRLFSFFVTPQRSAVITPGCLCEAQKENELKVGSLYCSCLTQLEVNAKGTVIPSIIHI